MPYVGQKFVGRLPEYFHMSMAVARHFMSVGSNLLDDMRKALRDLAEHKHRGLHPCLA